MTKLVFVGASRCEKEKFCAQALEEINASDERQMYGESKTEFTYIDIDLGNLEKPPYNETDILVLCYNSKDYLSFCQVQSYFEHIKEDLFSKDYPHISVFILQCPAIVTENYQCDSNNTDDTATKWFHDNRNEIEDIVKLTTAFNKVSYRNSLISMIGTHAYKTGKSNNATVKENGFFSGSTVDLNDPTIGCFPTCIIL